MKGGMPPKAWVLIAAISAVVPAAPAAAEFLPSPRTIGAGDESAVVPDIEALLARRSLGAPEAVSVLDGILGRLPRPTALRGLVQYLRAGALARDRPADARDAIEESIRLLPDYSGPLLLASRIETYSDQPNEAIAYLLRASRIDPAIVRRVPDYEIRGILSRLRPDDRAEQAGLLAARLFGIGWRGESLMLRSSLAADLIAARIEGGDLAGALAIMPELANPSDVRRLLTDNRYRDLWPSLEEWAGPRQERLWPVYLGELQKKWLASRDPEPGRPYLAALATADKNQRIISEFLPLFASLDPKRDYDLIWIAAPLAGALARVGRWDEIEQMFARALIAWPLGGHANALNLVANRGKYRYERGDFEGAVVDLRRGIDDASASQGEASATAISAMHFYLACALHALGRDSEAALSIAAVTATLSVSSLANLQVCLGRPDAAKQVLIGGLADEARRDDVIAWVQPDDSSPYASERGRMIEAARRALREDETLLAEVRKYGRILPYPDGAGAAGADGT